MDHSDHERNISKKISPGNGGECYVGSGEETSKVDVVCERNLCQGDDVMLYSGKKSTLKWLKKIPKLI